MRKVKKVNEYKKLLKEAEEEWKRYCIERDDRCQMCGSRENLQVHHIISRKHLATKFDPDNGITLCQKCHAKISLNSDAYLSFMVWFTKKFGFERIDELQRKSRQVKKWTMSELENLIENLRRRK